MKDRTGRCLFLAGALGVFSAGAMAEDSRLAVSGKYGTIGPGLDLTYGWSRDLHTRLSLNYAPEEKLIGKDEIRAAGALLLDWHPGGGAFRLSGGLAVLRREIAGLSSTEKLSVTASGSNSMTSYVGLGWGNPLRSGSRWSFSVDLGAFGGGGISYSTGPDGAGASPTAARASRDSGQIRVRSTWEPTIATGLSYRF